MGHLTATQTPSHVREEDPPAEGQDRGRLLHPPSGAPPEVAAREARREALAAQVAAQQPRRGLERQYADSVASQQTVYRICAAERDCCAWCHECMAGGEYTYV